jgi:aminoglycoside 6'-N-acetyltransferase
MMDTICGNEELGLRPLRDNSADYALLLKWLSNPDVCEYYEGRTKLFTMAEIKDKFMERAKGIDPQRVRVGIIQAQGKSIGFLQFYSTDLRDYDACANIAESKYRSPYGMDIVIGDTNYWNKGFGTAIMRQTMKFLFKREGADLILIDPQTWNKRAIRCYEKCGFTPLLVAKDRELQDGEPRDCLMMACTDISFQP